MLYVLCNSEDIIVNNFTPKTENAHKKMYQFFKKGLHFFISLSNLFIAARTTLIYQVKADNQKDNSPTQHKSITDLLTQDHAKSTLVVE